MSFPLFVLAASALAVATVVTTWQMSSHRWLAFGGAFAGSTLLLLFIGPGYFDCFADDAYITFRYSDHLAEGLGPNWNSTGRVEGYTNFSWMALLAGFDKIGFDIVNTSRVLGFAALLATFGFVTGIWRLWADSARDSGLSSPVVPAAVLVGLALTDGTTFWGFSGMETPLFTATLTGGAFFFLREERGTRVPWSAVAFAAAAMTRPEGLIAAAVTAAFLLARVATEPNRQHSVTRLMLWSSVFLTLFGSYFLWRFTYYDYLLPNTFYAKTGITSAVFERGISYVWTFGLRYQLIAMLAGTSLLLAIPRLSRDAMYILVLTSLMLAAIIIEGGDAFGHGRFIVPLLPLMYLGGLAGFATLLKRLSLSPTRIAIITSLTLGLGAFSLFPGLREQIPCRQVDLLHERQVLGEWFTEYTPRDYTIAAYAVGALGYYTDRDILDLLGINDVATAHTSVPNFGKGIAGHEKYNVDYVLGEVRPEIIVPNDAESRAITTEEFRARFGPEASGRILLFVDPRMWEDYEIRSLNVEGLWFNFLQRKDTIPDLQAPGLR